MSFGRGHLPVRFLGILSLTVVCAVASAGDTRPVIVGREEGLDACLSVAQVGGAKSGLISVRAGPGVDYREIDRLRNGQFVYACDDTSEWTGVVYLKGEEMSPDCGVTSPFPKPAPYAGNCKSGWVRTKWLTVVAG